MNYARKALLVLTAITGLGAAGIGRFHDNGLARTPPMGWNSWNHFGCNVSAQLIREVADAMAANGMRDAGYHYVTIDDCWQVARDAKGVIVADYVKIDWCNSDGLDASTQYAKLRDALLKSGRPIVFSICEWGRNEPWNWAPQVGNLWRTTGDIQDRWSSVMTIVNLSAQYWHLAKPGAWNDPDMLEVGNGGMTRDEYRSHFSLWAMMAAPLMAGNDVRALGDSSRQSTVTREILLNKEVIVVDQDSLGIQGMIAESNPPELQVWVKPLKDGSRAVLLFNRASVASNITVDWDRIGLNAKTARVRDLWTHKDSTAVADRYSATVPSHGVVMLRVWPGAR